MADQSLNNLMSGRDSSKLSHEKGEKHEEHEDLQPRWALAPTRPYSRIVNISVSIIIFLLPSFVASWFWPSTAASRPRQLHPTAYLDGLRGVAALIVYFSHTGLQWFAPFGQNAYGSSETDHYFLQLPFVRVLLAGRASVAVFFVISGYVLSIRTLTLIHQNRPFDRVLDSLSSGLFRRSFRLYIPSLGATAAIGVLMQLGLPMQAYLPNNLPRRFATVAEQFAVWRDEALVVANPFKTTTFTRANNFLPRYIGPMWTIPVEFRGSIAIFLLLLAFARTKRWVRMLGIALVGVILEAFYSDPVEPDMALFGVGMLFAELSLVFPPGQVTRAIREQRFLLQLGLPRRFIHRLHSAVMFVLLAVALYLFSYPDGSETAALSPAFRSLAASVPMNYRAIYGLDGQYWFSIGASILLFVLMYSPPAKMPTGADGLGESMLPGHELEAASALASAPASDEGSQPLLQRLLTSRFAQYLGTISFSLYLWHNPLQATIGIWYSNPGHELINKYDEMASGMAPDKLGELTSVFRWQYAALLPGLLWTTVAVIWVSDVWTRAVDLPAVRFARELERWVRRT